MKTDNKYRAHLFICTHQRTDGESCGAKGSQELRDQLKAICKKEMAADQKYFRVNSSGCLDHCKNGIAAVLYPQQEWFENLKKDDVDVLKQALQNTLEKSTKPL
jgi:predicted metal-binding protein